MTKSRSSAIEGSENSSSLRFNGQCVSLLPGSTRLGSEQSSAKIANLWDIENGACNDVRPEREAPTAERGSLFRVVLAYRGKLVVTAAQSRSVETVQQDTEKEEEAEGGRQGGREKLRDADKNVAGSQQDIP